MNKKPYNLLGYLILGISVLLSACSDKQDASTQKAEVVGKQDASTQKTEMVDKQDASTQKAAAIDQLTPRYESTLAEGIDFKKPGYPSFLIEASGVSHRADWGRWTDANLGPVAKFRFNKPLPKKFVLELQANAVGSNVGQPIKIRAGNIEQTITVKNWPDQTIYKVKFDEVASADTIEITPPNPSAPNDTDKRKLGVGLITLKIKTLD